MRRGCRSSVLSDQTGENWVPDRHDKTLVPRFNGEDTIPPSLERAIDAFLLACAARAARGQDREHNSMLVHVSRFVDVHQVVYRQVEQYLVNTRALISGGDAETIERLRRMWVDDFEPTTEEILPTVFGRQTMRVGWPQVLACLADSSDKIQVIEANGRSKSDIDYDSYENGRSLIAVGRRQAFPWPHAGGADGKLFPAHSASVRQPAADGPLVRLSTRLCRSMSPLYDAGHGRLVHACRDGQEGAPRAVHPHAADRGYSERVRAQG